MISFKKFVEGIHGAVLAANETLMSENEKVLDKYFEVTGGKGSNDVYRPKTAVIQCPKHTDDGVVMQNVRMPLITIAPVTMSQIDKVTLNVNLEMQLNGDEVNVGFRTPGIHKKEDANDDQSAAEDITLAQVEIILRPHDGPEGLNILIEGYEKALRAQMPG